MSAAAAPEMPGSAAAVCQGDGAPPRGGQRGAPRGGARLDGRLLFGAAALFAASAAATILACRSMPPDGDMPMPGGWTMSMAWMRMPGQTWAGAAAAFLGMWLVMMVAMMLPALAPALRRYRRGLASAEPGRFDRLTALVAAGYFGLWTAVGLALYPAGVALAAVAMRFPAFSRIVPVATGGVVLLAGLLQLTRWKALQLAQCGAAPDCRRAGSGGARAAWRHGLRLGWHCTLCCAGFTAVLAVGGVMDLSVMAGVTLALTLERVAPARLGLTIARITGLGAIAVGVFLVVRGLGTW